MYPLQSGDEAVPLLPAPVSASVSVRAQPGARDAPVVRRPNGFGGWFLRGIGALWLNLNRNLGRKILGMLVVVFLCALTAIGATVYLSWQLKGASAAINDAGSLRMRTYQMGYHLAQGPREGQSTQDFADRIHKDVVRFDAILDTLIEGDRSRPLFIPRDRGIPEAFDALHADWTEALRPHLIALADQPEPDRQQVVLARFDQVAPDFVDAINGLVGEMEASYEESTNLLQAMQILLAVLAVIGTLALIRFFEAQVIRPVARLAAGMRRMESEDLGVRVTIDSDDELGRLAQGFNRTAAHLQDLYDTLEARVATKTRTLTVKNRELEILYALTGFLQEAADIDTLCKGFLDKLQNTLGADAAAIRFYDNDAENLCLSYCNGLDDSFIEREALMKCASCLCGDPVAKRMSFITNLDDAVIPLDNDVCRQSGFLSISASPITAGKRPIGMFNLFFRKRDALDPSDRMMLATLGEQLGGAIDKLRLQARERELAVFEERNLLARELHDSIAQGLAFTNLQIQMLETALKRQDYPALESTIKMVRQGLQESYDDLRELMVHFRSRVDHRDLDSAISAALKRLSEQSNLLTHFDVRGDGAPIDPETETQLLYIIQEALSNIRKHANAKRVEVSLVRNTLGCEVTIRDDGVGFEYHQAVPDEQGHLGLEIMRERASNIGARVTVLSRSGQGTEVRLHLPGRLKEVA